MSDETTLLPCPFCGGEAHISEDYSSKRGIVYSVWHDCPAGGDYHPYGQGVGVLQVTSAWFSSREEAIAAWNARTLSILTAEQVREAIEHHGTASLGCRWQFTDRNLQAIADELNKLGSGACEVESEFWHDHGGDESDTYEFVLSCGHSVEWLDSEPPRHCPDCGRKVKR